MIETRLLTYFLAVAREQNITKAAETLHITQSTLSKQMMDLEFQLGKSLFIRGKRKLTLTEEGLFLRNKAQDILRTDRQYRSCFSLRAVI
ncbi:MAG: LysR family transcriptional regulator [Holdemania filiformis]